MYLNSPGGVVNSGFAIYDTMRFIKSEASCLYLSSFSNCNAFRRSQGTQIPMANITSFNSPNFYWWYVQGQASDLEITAREIIKTRKRINELLAQECNQSIEKYLKIQQEITG